MSYVIYRKSDSRIYMNRRTRKEYYDSERAAKAGLTRAANDGKIEREDYDIADVETYRNEIEQYEIVKNLMSGKEVRQSVNTPTCCDPSSETYWSM